jgi:hypothetical protein
MEDYEVLYEGKVFVLYSQVALFDAETQGAYPQWRAGKEIIVFGSRGVAVVAANDKYVNVVVCKGMGSPKYELCVSGEIQVGNQGLTVGNVPASDLNRIPLESGRYSVVIYTDGIGIEANKVFFFIERIE